VGGGVGGGGGGGVTGQYYVTRESKEEHLQDKGADFHLAPFGKGGKILKRDSGSPSGGDKKIWPRTEEHRYDLICENLEALHLLAKKLKEKIAPPGVDEEN